MKSTTPLILSIAALITALSGFSENGNKVKLLEVQVSTLSEKVSQLTQENLDCQRKINQLVKHANIPSVSEKDINTLARR